MNTLYFNELSNTDLYSIDGGWDWKNTVDVVVAVGCVAVGVAGGPAGAVISSIVSVGYAVGRGL